MDIEKFLFDDIKSKIFKNIDVFDSNYVPTEIKHRNSQITSMMMSIKPVLKNKQPVNTIILGKSATGKTIATKKVFEVVEQSIKEIISCYINCQFYNNMRAILSKLHVKIFGYEVGSNTASIRIFDKIMKHLKKEDLGLIIGLDDIDFLFHKKESNKLFYQLLRANETYDGVKIGLFVILSNIEFKYSLDKNVRTVFISREINFKEYNEEEVFMILKERCDLGFLDNVIKTHQVRNISSYCVNNYDLRRGINILSLAGMLADLNGMSYISDKHIEKAIQDTI